MDIVRAASASPWHRVFADAAKKSLYVKFVTEIANLILHLPHRYRH